jgi:hypothetical protein
MSDKILPESISGISPVMQSGRRYPNMRYGSLSYCSKEHLEHVDKPGNIEVKESSPISNYCSLNIARLEFKAYLDCQVRCLVEPDSTMVPRDTGVFCLRPTTALPQLLQRRSVSLAGKPTLGSY